MATHLLFKAASGWDIEKSLPFNPSSSLPKRIKNPNAIYSPLNSAGYATMNRDISRAIMHYAGFIGTEDNYEYGDFAIVKTGSTQYAAERKLADGTSEVVVWPTNGDIRAAIIGTTGRY